MCQDLLVACENVQSTVLPRVPHAFNIVEKDLQDDIAAVYRQGDDLGARARARAQALEGGEERRGRGPVPSERKGL